MQNLIHTIKVTWHWFWLTFHAKRIAKFFPGMTSKDVIDTLDKEWRDKNP